MQGRKKFLVIIIGFWLLLLILAMIRPLSLPDEGRYGDVGRWMYMSGDWLIPRLNGIPFFHKPPLLYWLQAIIFHFTGVHVWTARLVTAGHALIMITCLYFGVRKINGDIYALKVVVVLGSSIGFLIGGQFINHDFLVATWMTVAIGLFALALQSPGKINLLLARLGFVACGLGFLSKGLIGFVLPGLVILTWMVMTGQLRRLFEIPWGSGFLLFSGVTLPWLIAVQSRFPNFLNYFIIEQHFARFKGVNFNNPQPWWFYLPLIALYMFPWIFIVVWDLANRFKAGFSLERFRVRNIDPWVILPWVWVFVILIFFSIQKSKLMGYILPVIPPMAMLIVHSWNRFIAIRKPSEIFFWCICGLSAAVAVGANFLARHNSFKNSSLDIAHVLHCNMNEDDRVFVAGNYPYDLPFESNLQKPWFIIQDWEIARKTSADDWRRIFFEGADFEPRSGQVLQNMQFLSSIKQDGKSWLVTPAGFQLKTTHDIWRLTFKGASWWLWRTGVDPLDNLPATSSSPLHVCLSN